MRKYYLEDRERLYLMIKYMETSKHCEILRILKLLNEPFSEKSNGVFFDLETLTDETIDLIIKELSVVLKNNF